MTWAYEQDWCFGNTKEDEPKIILTVEEAKNLYHDFASMYVIAKGTYPKDGMRKPYTLDILKMQIEQADKRRGRNDNAT